jgi:SET domain-containing protein|tara:strand:+ start:136 stop:594 length:459 start_codon:yes stop_codon:yes gene_type:complete
MFKIKKSNIENTGLVATKNIKKDIRIIEYKGRLISKKETELNSKFDNDKHIYLFNINKKYDLDGDYKFNTARLINHSCNPNCEVTGKGTKLWISSIKDIKPGEELTYDYGFSFDENYKDFICKCGSKNCCGYIVREGSRWRIVNNRSKSKRI